MRIITLNLNGVRSAAAKGFFPWLAKQRADCVCLQETRAQQQQLTDPVYHPRGYTVRYHDAEKKGYSGVALYSRAAPRRLLEGLGWPDFDREGRWVRADYQSRGGDGNLSVASLYMPSGTSGDVRQGFKYELLERFKPLLRKLRRQRREWIICGDINIAHKNIDIENWRSNQKNSGFLPEERAWLDWLFDECGFVDVFRRLDQRERQYTWWSNRGRAWDKNVGWRIDYQFATPGIAACARRAAIYKDQRFSDHAPLLIEYDYRL